MLTCICVCLRVCCSDARADVGGVFRKEGRQCCASLFFCGFLKASCVCVGFNTRPHACYTYDRGFGTTASEQKHLNTKHLSLHGKGSLLVCWIQLCFPQGEWKTPQKSPIRIPTPNLISTASSAVSASLSPFSLSRAKNPCCQSEEFVYISGAWHFIYNTIYCI